MTSTDQMAGIASKHHGKLQACPEMTEARRAAIQEMVTLAKKNPLDQAGRDVLAAELSNEEARTAIKVSQPGKAPGEDGIIYEFYKKWVTWGEHPPDEEKVYPDITDILTRVWNAPSKRKGAPKEYVKGIMCLMYKKGDKRKVENYRPITLLNTDYKLETKGLATRMGKVVTPIIHPDQAGFVPGRDILDHIKLAKVVTEYCEVTELDGNIVALDQEKAYDRIDHAYLWEILKAYGLPDAFIERVKNLYKNAETSVMINRTPSGVFLVLRGVRQGDPLSCLLFNLAIEPLAESLRSSDLEGIRIPGCAM